MHMYAARGARWRSESCCERHGRFAAARLYLSLAADVAAGLSTGQAARAGPWARA